VSPAQVRQGSRLSFQQYARQLLACVWIMLNPALCPQAESIPFSFELNPYKADFRVSVRFFTRASPTCSLC